MTTAEIDSMWAGAKYHGSQAIKRSAKKERALFKVFARRLSTPRRAYLTTLYPFKEKEKCEVENLDKKSAIGARDGDGGAFGFLDPNLPKQAAKVIKAPSRFNREGADECKHFLLSCEASDDPEVRAFQEALLIRQARELMEKNFPGTPWIAVVHRNKKNVHCHVVCANYDCRTGKGIALNNKQLEDLRNFKWSSELTPSCGVSLDSEKLSERGKKNRRLEGREALQRHKKRCQARRAAGPSVVRQKLG